MNHLDRDDIDRRGSRYTGRNGEGAVDRQGDGRGAGGAARRAKAACAVGYVRRSTDKQEQSIPDQQFAIERYCQEERLTLVRFYIDDAISGTRAVNRPGFQEMLAKAQQRGCDFAYVVVYDVKRFGRLDNDEAGYYRHVLRTCGVEVRYVSEGFGGSDTDDLLRPVKQWQARQESKDLSKVTIRGLLSKADGGWWLGGVPPHGYDLTYQDDRGRFLFIVRFMRDGTKHVLDEDRRPIRTLDRGESISVSKRDRCRLAPSDRDRVKVIRTIFSLYTEERRGLAAIADNLNRNQVSTPRGPQWSHIYSGQWNASTVRAILVNPIYCGDMVWNRRTDARFHRISGGRAVERRDAYGARLVPNDPADWMIVRDTHPPLVPRRTWELADSIRKRRPSSIEQTGVAKRPEGGWSGMRSRFILSGLITCGRCGNRYQGVTRSKGKRRVDGSIVKTRYYGCGGYIAKGRSVCQFNPIKQEVLEQAVVDAVLAFYRERYQGEGGRERLAAAVRDHLGHEAKDLAEARRRLQADQEQIDGTIASLLDNMRAANRDLVEERLGKLRKQRAALATRAAELDRLAMNETEVQGLVQDVAAFIGGLKAALRGEINDHKRAALRRCITRIKVGGAEGSGSVGVRVLPAQHLDAGAAQEEVLRWPGTPGNNC